MIIPTLSLFPKVLSAGWVRPLDSSQLHRSHPLSERPLSPVFGILAPETVGEAHLLPVAKIVPAFMSFYEGATSGL